ncbi:MAG: hypothetical protein Q8P31_10675 [Bacillota bacterium]|nr:hypothetical protein [Bacillota bacterium]
MLVGGSAAYQYATVQRPLGLLLGRHAEVAGYSLSRPRGAPPTVEVQLRDVADLRGTYEELSSGLQQVLGRHNLVITDKRTPDLTAFYSQAQFALQEAAQNGNFVSMQAQLSGLAAQQGIQLRVGISSEHLFVQASSEQGALYEVVSRLGNGGTSRQ